MCTELYLVIRKFSNFCVQYIINLDPKFLFTEDADVYFKEKGKHEQSIGVFAFNKIGPFVCVRERVQWL